MKIKNAEVINYLNKSDLHDLPINMMELFFEKKEILFEFENWNEEKKDYIPFEMKLYNVTLFEINNYGENEFQVEELLEVNCKELNDRQFEAIFKFHKGAGKALWQINIIFSEIEVIYK